MPKKIALTPAAVDALNEGFLADFFTPGLMVEVLVSGKKRWRYRRLIAGIKASATLFGGLYPVCSIAKAMEWARGLNEVVQAGGDPRDHIRQERIRNAMTVAGAHELYMVAVRQGRASRAKRPNKARTITKKQEIFDRHIAPTLVKRSSYEIVEDDLIRLIEIKGRTAQVRANRLSAELKVFFGWASSLRSLEVSLQTNPSLRLTDLRSPEQPRSPKLSLLEIEWFLKALVAMSRLETQATVADVIV